MDLDFHEVLLTPSDLLEHWFCGRFTYFERHLALPEFQERREKVRRGRAAARGPRSDQPRLSEETARRGREADRREPDQPSAPSPRPARRGALLRRRDGRSPGLQVRQGPGPGLHDAAPPIGDLRALDPARTSRSRFAAAICRLHPQPEPGGRDHLQPEDFRRIGQAVREILDVIQRGKLPRRAPAVPLRRLLLPIYLRLSGRFLNRFVDGHTLTSSAWMQSRAGKCAVRGLAVAPSLAALSAPEHLRPKS